MRFIGGRSNSTVGLESTFNEEGNDGTNSNCTNWGNSRVVKPRSARDMEEMGLHLRALWTAILVLLGMGCATVGDICIVLPLHFFMGARI